MIFFKIFFVIIYFLNVGACPRQEDLYPCNCIWPEGKGVAVITCAKLENNHDLINAVKSLVGKNYILSISIQDSVFDFIPSDAFKGLKFVEFKIKNSTLSALTNADFAFEGLECCLKVLSIENYQLLNEWNWAVFSKLKKLERLEIKNGELESIEDLGKINLENLKTIDFTHNRINFIHDSAFAGSKNLKNIILRNNDISTLKRTMFPDPAFSLVVLNLSYNRLEHLPNDIFSKMPYLRSLDVGHNEILVLSEKVFKSVWSSLIEFKALGNNLMCDCRISWISQRKKPQITQATCAMPQTLKGKNIATLTSKDLWCIY